jgi:CheY-like chemotaxis protein
MEQEPDVILLDLSMPGFSGFELCQTLSSLSFTQKIPIFIVTGGDERNKTFCQNLGALRYFTKPVNFAELKSSLEWVFNTKRLERRRDLRVQLKIPLTLKGRRKDGADFETRVTTENVSKSGFLCACDRSLDEISAVEVSLLGQRNHRLGDARLVRVVTTDASAPRYGFQFTGIWTTPLIATPEKVPR